MAIPIRFEINFTNAMGIDYTIRILDTQHPAGISPMTISGDNFTIRYRGDDIGYDRFAPIITSTCEFSISYTGQNSTINSFVNNLIEYQEDRFYIEVLKYSEANVVWRGKVVQDLLSAGDILKSRFLKITASDGLSSLKSIKATDLQNKSNILDNVMRCIKKALPLDFWGNSDNFISTAVNWFEDGHTSTSIDPLRHSQVSGYYLFWTYDEEGNRQYKTLYECLEIMVRAWGARVFQSGGQWYFVQNALYKDDSIEFFTYSKQYQQVDGEPDNDGLGGSTFLAENDVVPVSTTPLKFTNGGEYTYLPAAKEAVANFNFAENRNVGRLTIVDLEEEGTIVIGPVSNHTDSNLRVELGLQANNLTFSPALTTPALDVTWTIRLGSYYLKADGTWTTTASTITYTYSFDPISNALIGGDVLLILTDEVPIDGTISVAMDYNDTNVTGGTTTANIIISYLYAGIKNAQVSAINTTAPLSSYIIDLGEIYFGDLPNRSEPRKLTIWDGTEWVDSSAWRFNDTGTTYLFSELLVLDAARGQKKPLRKYMGQLIGDIEFLNSISHNSYTYQFLSGEFNARLSTWRGEWVEADYQTTGITKDYVPFLEAASADGLFKQANNAITKLALASLKTAITSGSDVTTITVEALPVDLGIGQKITLIDKTTLILQEFEVIAAVQSGSNVSISVSGDSAITDFGDSSHVFVTGTNAIESTKKLNAHLTKSANYIANVSEFISADASGGSFTISIPTAVGNAGRTITICKIDATESAVVLDCDGSETMSGNAELSITTQWDVVKIESNGTNWLIV